MKDEDPLDALRTALQVVPSAAFADGVRQRVQAPSAPAAREWSLLWRIAAGIALAVLLVGQAYLRWMMEESDAVANTTTAVPSHTRLDLAVLRPPAARVSAATMSHAVGAVALKPARAGAGARVGGRGRVGTHSSTAVSFAVLFSERERTAWRNLLNGSAGYRLALAPPPSALVEIPTLEFPIIYPELATEGAQK